MAGLLPLEWEYNKMTVSAKTVSPLKPLLGVNNIVPFEKKKENWISLSNKIAGFAFFPIAPAAIAGVICSNIVKDSDKPINSPWVRNVAYLHPFTQLILPFIDLFLSLLSASLCRIQPFTFLLPIGIWNALNEFKALNLADQARDLKEQKEHVNLEKDKKAIEEKIQNIQKQVSNNNSLLGLFARVICLNLLFAPTYIPLMASIAGDTPYGKDLATTPLKTDVKNFKQYCKLVINNFWNYERKAVQRAIKIIFTPSMWRGTLLGKNEKIEKIIKEKKYNFAQAAGLRVVGGSLKTVLCLGIIVARYMSGILFLTSLPTLGLSVLNEGSKCYKKEDEDKAKKHPIAKFVFDLANKFSVLGMWLNGIVPMLATTPSNIKSSGFYSTISITMFGFLSLCAGISDFLKLDPVIGRTFFYLSKGFACLGSALSNLYRSLGLNNKNK